VRNNILAFRHNLHKFVQNFSKTSDDDLNKRVSKVLTDIESTTTGLNLQPTVIQGYANRAILEAHELQQDFQRAREKFSRGEMNECREDCIRLINSLAINLTLKSHVRFLYASIPTVSSEERRNALNTATETMRALYSGSDPNIWRDWEYEAGQLVRQIDAAAGDDLMWFY
jgi:hypothetical protein